MAQPSVSGPGHLFIRLATSSPIAYLGVCEATPRINYTPRFDQVNSDVAGSMLPHDYLYEGKEANMFCSPLTVYNWPILLGLQSRPLAQLTSPGVSWGIDPPGARGTLMVTEGFSYVLYVQFPYASKTAWGGYMPVGFRFPYSFLYGPEDYDLGTKPNKITIAFKMASKQQADGSWLLADSSFSGVPPVPPTALTGF